MRGAVAAALTALALAPAGAAAEPPPGQPDLWATVNVCDTPKRPDTIGIRASMPGIPRGTRVAMRFRVQYRTRDGWVDVADADSGWRRLGAAGGNAVQSGWSFTFARPSTGTVLLRGVAWMRWRRGGHTVRRAEVPTSAGHRSSAGADPPGYSAATCALGS
jgi:hypothetical protein